MNEPAQTVTLLLRKWRSGDAAALDELLPMVYTELRKLAASYMRKERPGHTLRPTELVGEAYLRLADAANAELTDRAHFFGIAARVMRQILVDHARKHDAKKRGDGVAPVTFDEHVVPGDRPADVIALDRALDALAELDERKAKAVELHYFGGLTHVEIADVLGVHANTVNRDLQLALAWIRRQLTEDA
jgi:RNA polymerase sigma-70 factor (ECF subfamily)